jgi:muramoyltetrapeptide carboxypeptidase
LFREKEVNELSTGQKPRRTLPKFSKSQMARPLVNKPPHLRPGARIGIVAPAGSVSEEALELGIAAIKAEGFKMEVAPHVYARKGYLAGDQRLRALELNNFFERPDIDAIFCARGGFGSVQLLPFLSGHLSKLPKIFVGYSDITILINWFRQSCNMVAFHAPMVTMDLAKGLSNRSRQHFWEVLTGERHEWTVRLSEVIRPGRARAEIMGGCLSLLVTTLGTPYEINPNGKILFLEDVGEKPYRIERMLTHLQMARKFEDLAGVVVGDFTNCADDGPRDVRQIFDELFDDAQFPVLMGMSAGHGAENLALPFGVPMLLDGVSGTLSLDESPVS